MLVLEKAISKLFGSYNALSEGSCLDGLIDLTNCPTFEYKFNNYDKEKLWNDFKKWIDYEYLLSVVAKKTEIPEGMNVKTEELTYAVLRFYENI